MLPFMIKICNCQKTLYSKFSLQSVPIAMLEVWEPHLRRVCLLVKSVGLKDGSLGPVQLLAPHALEQTP